MHRDSGQDEPQTLAPGDAQRQGRAYRYSFISLAARVVLQALSGILIARALGPSTFGLGILVVSAYTVVASVIAQGANGPLLIRSRIPAEYLRRTLLVDAALGVAGAAGFLVAAAVWTGGGTSARAALLVAGLGCLVQAASGPALALNARDLHFDRIARGEVLGAVAGASTGIAVAFSTGSVLALPVQAVVVDVVILLAVLPAFAASRRTLPSAFAVEPGRRYAVQTSVNQLSSIGSRNVDNYLVVALLGREALGVYVLAYRLMMLPIQNVAMVLTRVLVPKLRHLATDRRQADAEVRNLLLAVALLTGPATGAVLPVLAPLVDLVFGPEWDAAAAPTAVLLLAAFPQCAITVCAAVLASHGHSREQLALTTAGLAAAALAVVVGAPAGVLGVTIAYVVLTLIMLGVAVGVTFRVVGLAPSVIGAALGFHLLAAGAAAGTALLLTELLAGPGGALMALAVATVAGLAAGRLLSRTRFAAAVGFWRALLAGRP